MVQAIKQNGFIVEPATMELVTGECQFPDGTVAWAASGILHRDPKEGPAWIDVMGAKHYVVAGKLDRIVFPWQTEVDIKPTKVIVRDARRKIDIPVKEEDMTQEVTNGLAAQE